MMIKEPMFAQTTTESKLLSCLLFNPRQMKLIADRLRPDDFYRDIHKSMFKIMLKTYRANKRCTADLLRYELKKIGRLAEAEEHGRLTEIAESPYSMGDVEALAQTIREEATFRSLANFSSQVMEMAASRNPDAIRQAMEALSCIALGTESVPTSSLSAEVDLYLEELEQRRQDFHNNIAHGLATGYPDLDKSLGGFQQSGLYILAALTGLGKSAFSLNLALNIVAQHAMRVLLFTLEMDNWEIVQRVFAIRAEIDNFKLMQGDIDDDEMAYLKKRAEELKKYDFLLDDRTYSIDDIIAKAHREHSIKPLNLVIVDYAQLVEIGDERKGANRSEIVSTITRKLKKLARDLKIPVLALAQVSREVDKQGEPIPKLSHLSESAGLATHANVVLLMYTTTEHLVKSEANETFTVFVNIAKGRNSRKGVISLLFAPRITKYKPWSTDEEDYANG